MTHHDPGPPDPFAADQSVAPAALPVPLDGEAVFEPPPAGLEALDPPTGEEEPAAGGENGEQPAPDGESDEPPASPQEQKKKPSLWRELPVLILIALVVAVLIKTFLVQAFWIPSASMVHTLEINDRVLVNKLAYLFGEPQRQDVVVFNSPLAPTVDEPLWRSVVDAVGEALGAVESDAHLIKRVIGLPGETLEIRDSRVLIDGEPIDEPYLAPGTVMPDYGPVTIPEGHLFMMGDNRAASSDSRRFGTVPESDVVGRAFITVWPPGRWRTL